MPPKWASHINAGDGYGLKDAGIGRLIGRQALATACAYCVVPGTGPGEAPGPFVVQRPSPAFVACDSRREQFVKPPSRKHPVLGVRAAIRVRRLWPCLSVLLAGCDIDLTRRVEVHQENTEAHNQVGPYRQPVGRDEARGDDGNVGRSVVAGG